MGKFTTIEKRGRVAVVRFDRGDKLNALSDAVMRELTEVARSFEDDLETSAIVLTGADKFFSAGADLTDSALVERNKKGLMARRHALKVGPDMCDAWERLEQITICAVEGFCIGGGSRRKLSIGGLWSMWWPTVKRLRKPARLLRNLPTCRLCLCACRNSQLIWRPRRLIRR